MRTSPATSSTVTSVRPSGPSLSHLFHVKGDSLSEDGRERKGTSPSRSSPSASSASSASSPPHPCSGPLTQLAEHIRRSHNLTFLLSYLTASAVITSTCFVFFECMGQVRICYASFIIFQVTSGKG